MNNFSGQYSNFWKHFNLADVEFRNDSLIFNVSLWTKSLTKSTNPTNNPLSDLNYDWRSGAGNCTQGRCDGTHIDKNAWMIWEACHNLTIYKYPNGFFTDIYCDNENMCTSYTTTNPYVNGSDTLMYRNVVDECIESVEMKYWFNRQEILKSRYKAPQGFSLVEVTYGFTLVSPYSTSPFKIWSNMNFYVGKLHFLDDEMPL